MTAPVWVFSCPSCCTEIEVAHRDVTPDHRVDCSCGTRCVVDVDYSDEAERDVAKLAVVRVSALCNTCEHAPAEVRGDCSYCALRVAEEACAQRDRDVREIARELRAKNLELQVAITAQETARAEYERLRRAFPEDAALLDDAVADRPPVAPHCDDCGRLQPQCTCYVTRWQHDEAMRRARIPGGAA